MIYTMIEPPFKFDSFETLTKQQAQQLFDWYISMIPERAKLLEECFNKVWRCNLQFDYSLESLDLLWAAFEKHIEIEEKTEKQIRAENKGMPEYVIEEELKDRRYPSRGTYMIALDIAMYFGEALARHLPGIHWGFFTKPKKMASVNEAVLLGFGKRYMDPTRIVRVACQKSINSPKPYALSEIIEVWKGFIPDA